MKMHIKNLKVTTTTKKIVLYLYFVQDNIIFIECFFHSIKIFY